jgi:hypothetical protein
MWPVGLNSWSIYEKDFVERLQKYLQITSINIMTFFIIRFHFLCMYRASYTIYYP